MMVPVGMSRNLPADMIGDKYDRLDGDTLE